MSLFSPGMVWVAPVRVLAGSILKVEQKSSHRLSVICANAGLLAILRNLRMTSTNWHLTVRSSISLRLYQFLDRFRRRPRLTLPLVQDLGGIVGALHSIVHRGGSGYILSSVSEPIDIRLRALDRRYMTGRTRIIIMMHVRVCWLRLPAPRLYRLN